ncbi:ribosome rescue protein RqcH [Fervidicoccus fontis]|uniref:Putative RNA-binding protein, eukaryotic snRNP-like protein n=1 Tax=Fervidicoccus fontis (strain DSM 19380 / JCM 18336 / VKM B-2539 / Kam940) TaxID=1163730 RepID=H9ZZX5_FERFK|nr:ribosome rescue protein RqcH [Fervidicoccus fontis]AFH42282.1 putative RNA-binding protein, eukaryotic snRNP-like protein [Fervidicoccus fontis Kam940]
MNIKESMTVIDLIAFLRELEKEKINLKVSNIYHIPQTKRILIKLKDPYFKFLVAEASKKIYFSKYSLPTPEKPSIFALSLRKYLNERVITSIKQIGFDRILKLEFDNDYALYIELLPRGEIILTDPTERIIHASSFKKMRDRKIERNSQYILPPIFEKRPTAEMCIEALSSEGKKGLIKKLGLPHELIDEAIGEVGCENCFEKICNKIEEIMGSLGIDGGYIVHQDDTLIAFYPFNPSVIHKNSKIEKTEKFNDALDKYFYSIDVLRPVALEDEEISRTKASIDKIREDIEKGEQKVKELYEVANRLASFSSYIEEKIKCAREVQKKYGWEKVKERCPGIQKVFQNSGEFTLDLEGKEYKFNIFEDAFTQIGKIFDEAKKLKKKVENAKANLETLELKLKELNLKKHEKEREVKAIARKRDWYEKYIWSFTRNRLLIIAGRDAQQNEAIVKKYLMKNKKSLYFHAEIHGAPSTILLAENEDIKEEDIYDTSVIAASYSKAWKASLKVVDVFWVHSDQVSKTPPAGEYLEKGSFMIYGEKNYVRNVPLKLGIGLQQTADNAYRFFVGSEESVKKNSYPVAIIEPGNIEAQEVANKIYQYIKNLNFESLPSLKELVQIIPGKSNLSFEINH